MAQFKLAAAQDEAAALMALGKATADVIHFENEAKAAGWKRSVESFGGDGQQFARYVLYQKMAGAYQQIMVNTADSPLMRIFDAFAPPQQSTTGPQPIEE
ncbi:MAG: hypothetical protein ABGX16_25885 [Pirellulales bacterium]